MHTRSDPSKTNTKQSVSEFLSQKGGDSNFQFVDNRPESVASKKHQEMANASPRSKQLRELQQMADSRPQIVQRTVFQSTSYVASEKGKWYSDQDTPGKKQFFDTKDEAIAHENKLNDVKKKNDEKKLKEKAEEEGWKIIDAARRHYGDGWGDSYGITNDEELKKYIDTHSSEATKKGDSFELSLGKRTNEKGQQIETCNILYEEMRITVKDDGIDFQLEDVPKRFVFHCGPSTRASQSASGTKTQPSAISGEAESGNKVDRFPALDTTKQ